MTDSSLDSSTLGKKTVAELKTIAAAAGVKVPSSAKKDDVIGLLARSGPGEGGGARSSSGGSDKPTGNSTPRTDRPRPRVSGYSASPTDQGKSEGERDEGSTRSDPSDPSGADDTTEGSEGRQRGRSNRSDRGDRGDRNRNNNRGFDNYATDDGGRGRNRRGRGRGRNRRGENGGNYDSRAEQAAADFDGEPIPIRGIFEIKEKERFGFIRTKGYKPCPEDVYVPVSFVAKYGLRPGDVVEGTKRPASSNEKYEALHAVSSVSGLEPDKAKSRPKFESLTPLFPDENLRLELKHDPLNMTARIVDLMSPVGKGQRGLIVSPPKAGKTTVVKQIAKSIETNNPEVHLMVLLVDERPEEVTDMQRLVSGEVIASTFDRPAEEHTRVAELCIERAKRLVELGTDVVIILDGITRLARAYNLAAPASGRILSGGVDSGALYPPKKFFGAARNIEEGGSLTILATALVETGSKMDEVIFEEFKGTGNMELKLDRRLAERRLYPAIDANGSSTRHEELLFSPDQLKQIWKLRRVLNGLAQDGNTAAGLELLMDKIRSTRTNDEFLSEIAKNQNPGT